MESAAIRILFMGTPQFALPSLEAIYSKKYHIAGVVTQREKPQGRGRKILPSPVKEFSLKHNIEVFEPFTLKDASFKEKLASLALDLIVVVAYGKILPEDILNMPKKGCVNLHASLLPYYRGAAPINRAIINGEKKTGVTTMFMDKGMDTGPILFTEEVSIGDEETSEELSERMSKIGAGLLIKTLDFLDADKITPLAQDEGKATYAPALKKEDGRIDWSLGCEEVKNRIRGLKPWPGAWTFHKGKLIKIHAGIALADVVSDDLKPGAVLDISKDGIKVKCGKGVFKITELQLEGKKRMSTEEFLRGYKIEKEEVFS